MRRTATPAPRRSSPLVLTACLLLACSPEPQAGSQTHWMSHCAADEDCGGLQCVCGICTSRCSEKAPCEKPSSCVAAEEDGAVAVCDGFMPLSALCLQRCDTEGCPEGTTCEAEVCVPTRSSTTAVTVDPGVSHQSLIGIGASFVFNEAGIDTHPQREALLDAMFSDVRLNALRISNRFNGTNASELEPATRVVQSATSRLGRTPTLLLTTASPPPALKGNGSTYCSDADPKCTLIQDTTGAFDYAAYAEYWRSSLAAYDAAQLHPDFVSIQNHPEWVPPDAAFQEACRFLPQEGTTTVTLPDGSTVEARFPGYLEALQAVLAAVAAQGSYGFTAPETVNPYAFSGYASVLDPSMLAAYSYDFYGIDPAAVDTAVLQSVADEVASYGKPLLQTEVSNTGFETAVLIQVALTSGGASGYVHQGLLGSDMTESSTAPFGSDGTTFVATPVAHALRHFARFTEPGWIRVDAASSETNLLSSAWTSPDGTQLTVLLINQGEVALDVGLAVPEVSSDVLQGARVIRTTFPGVERSVELGALGAQRVVRLPSHSLLTVTTKP